MDQQASARVHHEPGAVALAAMVHPKRPRAGVAMTDLAARTPGGGPRSRIDSQHEHAGQHDREPPPRAARPRALTSPVLLPRSRLAPGRSRASCYHRDPARWRKLDSNLTKQPAMLARPAARARPPRPQTRPNRITSRRGLSPLTDQSAGPSDGIG